VKSHVIYVIQQYPVGTQTFVENEAAALERLGYKVTLFPLRTSRTRNTGATDISTARQIFLSPKHWPSLLTTIKSLVVRWPAIREVVSAEKFSFRDRSRQLFALTMAFRLTAFIRAQDHTVDFVHAHFLGRCLDVAVYSKLLDSGPIRTTATGHAGDVVNPSTLHRLRTQIPLLDGVVCASNAVAEALKTRTNHNATGVIHCGITPAVRTAPPNNDGPLRILSVGRLVEKKGYQDAISAARSLMESGADFKWKIVGDGPMADELNRLSEELVRSGKMEWLGAQPSAEVLTLLSDWADVFVLACKPASNGDIDGIPVALMEAMTAKVAVISSRVAGIPELIESGVTGLLNDPGDTESLTRNLELLLKKPEIRASIANAGKEFVDREFSLETETLKLADMMFGARLTKS